MLENTLGQSVCRIFYFWLVWLVNLNTKGPLLHCTYNCLVFSVFVGDCLKREKNFQNNLFWSWFCHVKVYGFWDKFLIKFLMNMAVIVSLKNFRILNLDFNSGQSIFHQTLYLNSQTPLLNSFQSNSFSVWIEQMLHRMYAADFNDHYPSPWDIEILGWCPVGSVLHHGEKVQPWLATILVMILQWNILWGRCVITSTSLTFYLFLSGWLKLNLMLLLDQLRLAWSNEHW